ncbi:hypothetical protein CVT26_003629 [Gymnopilus dilepis]|uniref:Cyanovirin-N domain-containing protein n=1 Tax=Gymnopilus dilepis TaxID=231916 RepID=A0A409VR72_9AGAR|nr:hypothetical protein CVT26_003629 [Gymnopilus dilepis]
MLFNILLLASIGQLCVAVQVTTSTFQWRTRAPLAFATPTPVQRNITTTRTITATISHVQTPTPHFPAGWKSPIENAAALNTSLGAHTNLASGYGTSCCGWGGIFGWNGDGTSVATMAGNCGPNLPLSSLDLNKCISWDSSSGWATCSNAGGFLSNSASGCVVMNPPSVWGQAFGAPTYTQIWVVCNGPQAGTGYISQFDLSK